MKRIIKDGDISPLTIWPSESILKNLKKKSNWLDQSDEKEGCLRLHLYYAFSVLISLRQSWPVLVSHIQGVYKKGTLDIFVLFRFWKSDFTFSHVFRNQNFEPVSSHHSNCIHSESKLPKKRMHGHDFYSNLKVKLELCRLCILDVNNAVAQSVCWRFIQPNDVTNECYSWLRAE